MMETQGHFETMPTWLGLFAMLGLGLAFVAFVVVMSVLLAAGVHVISSRRIKAIGVLMLFIIPAIAVVGMIGMEWGAARVHAYRAPAPEVRLNRPPSVTKAESATNLRRGTGKKEYTVKSVSTGEEGKTKSAVVVEIEGSADEPASPADLARSQNGSGRFSN